MKICQIAGLPRSGTNFCNNLIVDNFDNAPADVGKGELVKAEELANPLLALLIAQGILAGLFIGKITEGSIKFGAKHSFILASSALLIATGARVLLNFA